jgi:hypothetical protein
MVTAGLLLAAMFGYEYATDRAISRAPRTTKALIEIAAWSLGSLCGSMSGLHLSSRKRPAIPLGVGIALAALNTINSLPTGMPFWFSAALVLASLAPAVVVSLRSGQT